MPTIRKFTTNDALSLQKYSTPSLNELEIKKIIDEWNTEIFDGKFFRMYAVCVSDEIVGTVSLYQHSGYIISAGPEIFKEFRQKGYGYSALISALDEAKKLGYMIASAQIRVENTPSIRLHEKCGFFRDSEMTNSKGNKVYIYLKVL